MGSSRFIVATHVLTLLGHEDRALTSDYIAGSVNTNPVVIRRVVAQLAKAGLVVSVEGSGGGTTLNRKMSKMSLAEVYEAVENSGELFGMPRSEPNPNCPVGRSVQTVLRSKMQTFENAMLQKMRTVTVADIHHEVLASV